MLFREWLATIAQDLGDWPDQGGPLSYQRFPLATLQAYYQEAMCTIAATYRPKAFTSVRRVKLSPGAYQDLSGCCPDVQRVLSQVDASGVTVKVLPASGGTTRHDWATLWNKPCAPTVSSAVATVGSVVKVRGAQSAFMVDPPVPVGADVFVDVVCAGAAPAAPGLDDSIDNCKYLAAVRNYVLSVALAGQLESQSSMAHSTDFMKRFVALMTTQRTTSTEVSDAA